MKLFHTALLPVTLALLALPVPAGADQPLGELKVKSISLKIGDDGSAVLRVAGTAEELGNCTGYGELSFVRGEEGTLEGTGVIAFAAANGDLLVGIIAAQYDG